jgi:hypothetical protein
MQAGINRRLTALGGKQQQQRSFAESARFASMESQLDALLVDSTLLPAATQKMLAQELEVRTNQLLCTVIQQLFL